MTGARGAQRALRGMQTAELEARCRRILAELSAVFAHLDVRPLGELAQMVLDARRVVCTGQGRSGLIASALAVRLVHLGRDAHVAGEATVPALGCGDLLIAFSKSGTTATTAHQVVRAQHTGARVAVITGRTGADLAELAELALVLPDLDAPSRQHAGSLFEQASLVLSDSLCGVLQHALGLSDRDLDARHDNLQ